MTCNNLNAPSFIHARDPSIACFYNVERVRQNLVNEYENVEYYDDFSGGSSHVETDHYQVYLRIKHSPDFVKLYEIRDNTTLVCKGPDDTTKKVREMPLFKFSKIIDPQWSQTNIFNGIIKHKVLKFINGYNCTLMSYGASGSGKTFTIVGTAEQPGIIPRSLEYLFRTLPSLPECPKIKPDASGNVLFITPMELNQDKTEKQRLLTTHHINMDYTLHLQTYKAMQDRLSCEPVAVIDPNLGKDIILSVWISFAEIYNENVYDLLKPNPSRGQRRRKLQLAHSKETTYIKGLTSVSVSSGLEAYLILQYGLHNLNYAATSINNHSSRSHCIFTLKIAQASRTDKNVRVSIFNFCDLAGAERSKMTHNIGDRLKESNSINTSLLVLGRCIKLVRHNQKNNYSKLIPFRESKLTDLFQKSLLGQEAVSMIVSINSSRQMFEETQHVLNFSAIAQDIISKSLKSDVESKLSTIFSSDLDMSVFEGKTNLSELIEQISILTDELEQEKLNNVENMEFLIKTYRKILNDAHEYWKNKCDTLRDLLVDVLTEKQETETKRAKLSVIVLDSSTEDDSDDESNENKDDLVIKELKEEIEQMQFKIEAQREKIKECQELEDNLENRLPIMKEKCIELKIKSENEIKSLESKLVSSSNQFDELNKFLDLKDDEENVENNSSVIY